MDPDWGTGHTTEGGMIVYASHTFGAAHSTIYVMDANGTTHIQVTEENVYHSPGWQPVVSGTSK